MSQITCVMGTRPEVVKMAPVILRLRGIEDGPSVRVLSTGQHRGLLDQALADFDITADRDLELMRHDQGLADLTARALVALSEEFAAHRPELVLAQGDTTTVLTAALACYYQRIPFGHVEAGLRTWDPYAPFPEEKNRVLTGHLAELHFAPTPAARANLLCEGIDPDTIHVTGNTVVDALQMIARRPIPLPVQPATNRYLLVTAHRRENFGEPLAEICRALLDLVGRDPELSIVFTVHPNPRVRQVVDELLVGHDRIHLLGPAGYPEFVALMKSAEAILTDSGGVQEEAPGLGKAVFVLRDATERPEAVEAGLAWIVGPHRSAIVSEFERWRERQCQNRNGNGAGRPASPYGDGWASERIARVVAARFGIELAAPPAGVPVSWPGAPTARCASLAG
jgi:UDP-N-acetylglucosamine 2-epimerase (non-hydrolysing)